MSLLAIFFLILFVLFLRKRSFFSIICSLCFLSAGVLLLGLSAIGNLIEEKPVLKITVTGEKNRSLMEWKNPSGSFQSKHVDCHEVVLTTMDGEEVGHYFIPGELCALRAKIFRFHPMFSILGVKNKYRFDLVYSGYRSAQGYKTQPVEFYPFIYPLSRWNTALFQTWESFFFQRTALLGTTAVLESNYFPLTNEKGKTHCTEYSILVSSSGLFIKSIPKI